MSITKVAHFAQFAPTQSGQYATVKDLIQAERKAGIQAEIVDFGYAGKHESRIGLKDDFLESVNMDYAKDCDLIFRHSCLPEKVKKWPVPKVLCLHGRPESSFLLEHRDIVPVISEILKFKGPLVTFWDEFAFHWHAMTGRKVLPLTAPVDLDKYNPDGYRHEFKPSGTPNIIVCDMWREDTTPYNVIMAAAYYVLNYNQNAKVHVYGMPETKAFDVLKKLGVLGEVYPAVDNLETVYRSADLLVTPHVIATRVVRESLASGLPIVAGTGCRYTPFTANPRDIPGFAKAINSAWRNVWSMEGSGMRQMREWFRRKAEESFSLGKDELGKFFESIKNMGDA